MSFMPLEDERLIILMAICKKESRCVAYETGDLEQKFQAHGCFQIKKATAKGVDPRYEVPDLYNCSISYVIAGVVYDHCFKRFKAAMKAIDCYNLGYPTAKGHSKLGKRPYAIEVMSYKYIRK
jgi:hypothetical protein